MSRELQNARADNNMTRMLQEKQLRVDTAVEVRVTRKVGVDVLEGIILNAIEGGVHGIYGWSPKQRLRIASQGFEPPVDGVVVDRKENEHWHEYIARNVVAGGTLTIYEDAHDNRDEDTYVPHHLTREKLLDGLGRFLGEFSASGGAEFDKDTGLTEYDFDAPDCDLIIQLALFGEVVYG
jgi:hypothetical protein